MRFPQFDNNPKNEHDLKCFESKGNFSKLSSVPQYEHCYRIHLGLMFNVVVEILINKNDGTE